MQQGQKKTAWNTWKAFDEATETFANLAVEPFLSIEDDSKEVETLERFVIYMQLADIKSAGISGTPLDFVEFNSFNRTFTIVYIVKNK